MRRIFDTANRIRLFLKASMILLLLASLGLNSYSQVVINEVYVNPSPDSLNPIYQSMVRCSDTTFGAEWVEIYNSARCDTIDLSCYILGARTADTNYTSFGFPSGTKIAPLSFITVGGPQAAADFNLADFCGSGQLCGPGTWSLDNDYGWVALYDANGNVLDAVYWTAVAGVPGERTTNTAYDNEPCIPPGCSFSGSLPDASQMTGAEISYAGKAPTMGLSIRRTSDGGGVWETDATPTPGNCNGVCAPPSTLQVQVDTIIDETCLLGNGFIQILVTGGAPQYDIDWSNGRNIDSIENLTAGTYSVTVQDFEGCTVSLSNIDVNNVGMPVDVQVEPSEVTIFNGESVSLSLNTTAIIDSVDWDPTSGLSCSDCAAPVASPTITSDYQVTVTDNDGCTGTATTTINVISDQNSVFVPTAFTPNQDFNNDLLFVRSPKLAGLEFHIYDRWGKEVFFTQDLNEGWDGTDKDGRALNAGIYVYYVIATFDTGKEKTITGNVALLR